VKSKQHSLELPLSCYKDEMLSHMRKERGVQKWGCRYRRSQCYSRSSGSFPSFGVRRDNLLSASLSTVGSMPAPTLSLADDSTSKVSASESGNINRRRVTLDILGVRRSEELWEGDLCLQLRPKDALIEEALYHIDNFFNTKNF
jgi:hypothetical protein